MYDVLGGRLHGGRWRAYVIARTFILLGVGLVFVSDSFCECTNKVCERLDGLRPVAVLGQAVVYRGGMLLPLDGAGIKGSRK